jgi:hypothetical protein
MYGDDFDEEIGEEINEPDHLMESGDGNRYPGG